MHSSTLLVGYAVELFLKAGLTRLYVGCSKELFQKDVKGRYSHDLIKLSKSVEYPGLAGNREQLKQLKKVTLSEGRWISVDIKRLVIKDFRCLMDVCRRNNGLLRPVFY